MPYRTMMDNFFSSKHPMFALSSRVWNPPTDIYETDSATFIRIEVAGLEEDQIRIATEKNLLIVRGRRNPIACQKVSYHLMEVHFGEFERVFAFSHKLDDSLVKANYDKGFLTLEIPKQSPVVTNVTVKIIHGSGELK